MSATSPNEAAVRESDAAVASSTGQPVDRESTLAADLPQVLRYGEFAASLLAGALGIVVGLGAAAAINSLPAESHAWVRLFALDGVQAVIPIAMLCMFFWGLAACVIRWIRLRSLLSVSNLQTLEAVERVLGRTPASLASLSDLLHGPTIAANPLLRRVRAVVQQWQVHADLAAALALVEQHAIHDEDSVRRGFGTLRTFVWALPVLGLIGTVVGIAGAVSDFSGFLGSQVEDVTAIKQSLVAVTGGLAFAFAATILGLAASLALMLPAAALQSKEERFYGSLQSLLSEVFLPTLQRHFPAAAPNVQPQEDFREAMLQMGRQVSESTGAVILRTGEQLLNALAQSTRPVQESNERIVADVVGQLSDMKQAATRADAALEAALDRHAVSLAALHVSLVCAIETQADSVNRVSGQLAELANATQGTLQAQQHVEGGLEALLALPPAMENAAAAVNRLAALRTEGEAATRDLMQSTERVLAAQTELQAAMSTLDATGLSRLFTHMVNRLEKVSDVLEGFRQPMVLQAIPLRMADGLPPAASEPESQALGPATAPGP